MKKLFLASIFASVAVTAYADDALMVFKTSDGAIHSIGSSALEIHFADGNMLASNGSQSLTLPLADLKSMEFGNLSTVISDMAAMPEGMVSVTALDGAVCGKFDSVKEAAATLGSGVYVVKYESGETIKIFVRK